MFKMIRASTYKKESKAAAYNSALILMELCMVIIQISLFLGFYFNQSPYSFEDVLGL